MVIFNAAALERASKKRGGAGSGPRRMTAEVLGRIIACAWRAESDGELATLLTPASLSARILEHLGEAPDEIAGVLHVDRRVDGDEIEEASQLLVGAQGVGVLGRLNPTHVTAFVRADAVQADALLDQFKAEFPSTVEWARKLARKS